jgi:ribonuclease R
MRNRELEERVLAHVSRPEYRPVKPKVIAKQLGLDDEGFASLKTSIRRLVKSRALRWGPRHLVMTPKTDSAGKKPEPTSAPSPAAPRFEFKTIERPGDEADQATKQAVEQAAETARPTKKRREPERLASTEKDRSAPKKTSGANPSEVKGIFRRVASGNGFVRPSDRERPADRADDIFIPREDSRDAASGDTVVVRLTKMRRGPKGLRQGGMIVEILERDTHQFVGVYGEEDGQSYVTVDGAAFAAPIWVGDPGAKNAAPGDKVVIEIVRFPSPAWHGEGVIVEVLGPKGKPGVDTLSVMREFQLPDAFPEHVLEEARENAAAFDENNLGDRTDMRSLTTITIDPKDARDFDDAISLEMLEAGFWRLYVHIADVGHFVPPKSALDAEARERATSVYLPDRVLPMIPEVISNNVASLQPDKVRFAKTAIIDFTPEGVRCGTDLARTAIRSDRRFTYEEVDEFLADAEAWKSKLTPEVFALLEKMRDLARMLRRRRMEAGAIDLNLPQTKIDLDRNGRVCGAHLDIQTESHQIIEEFMLAANEAVATVLSNKQIEFLRRVHESPEPKKLKTLTSFVREIGFDCGDLGSRFAIKRVVKESAGQPEERAVHYAVLRAMQRAHYSPMVAGHYALGMEDYCHFTSPIRRYPDLTIHRLVDMVIAGKKPAPHDWATVGEHCSDREQRAQLAERELTKVKLLEYLSTRVGEEMDAVVTGVEEFGFFAQGIELPAEGLVRTFTLRQDTYRYDKDAHCLSGTQNGNYFRLGDMVRVEIARVDVDRRELDFKFVEKLRSTPVRRSKRKRSDRKGSSTRRPRQGRTMHGKEGRAEKRDRR